MNLIILIFNDTGDKNNRPYFMKYVGAPAILDTIIWYIGCPAFIVAFNLYKNIYIYIN